MKNKLMYRLVLIISLFVVSLSQPAFSADNSSTSMTTTTKMIDQIDKLNINSATSEQLMAIKGIGATKAQAIVTYRHDHGKFTDLHQVVNVKGIGETTYKKIMPFLTL